MPQFNQNEPVQFNQFSPNELVDLGRAVGTKIGDVRKAIVRARKRGNSGLVAALLDNLESWRKLLDHVEAITPKQELVLSR